MWPYVLALSIAHLVAWLENIAANCESNELLIAYQQACAVALQRGLGQSGRKLQIAWGLLMNATSHKIQGCDVTFQEWDNTAFGRHVSLRSVLDFVLTVICLIVLSPVILAAMLLVRLSSRGPAIYTQKRAGLNGKMFTIYKIRSMYLNSEPNGARWCTVGDSRVTPIGRLIRATHIDEMPQLINILQGDMGLIGPRPERPEIVAQLERAFPDYGRRLLVRPGLTGLAQVLQAPDTDLASVRRKLNYDIYYVDRISPGLDLRILVATALLFLCIPKPLIASLFRFPYEQAPKVVPTTVQPVVEG
jgi:lipopolysaccharide/colanic/teichoic acid biosynthesis glycosyltransferase